MRPSGNQLAQFVADAEALGMPSNDELQLLRWLHAEAAFERDHLRAVVDHLRDAHHIPYEDEDHQRGSCADVVIGLIGKALKAEQELERLNSWQGLMSLLDEHWPATVFKGSTEDPGPTIVFLLREVDRLRREVEFEARGESYGPMEGLYIPWVGEVQPCACISEDQAAQLGPGFSRPVCAVHPPGSPISTLTGMPCTHGPDSRCVECVEECGVRIEPTSWQPGDPVYRDEREDSGEGACSDPACGVTWTPAGPTDCPRCGSPAVPAPAGTPWAEGGA